MSEQNAFPLSWPATRPRTPRHRITASAFGKHSLAEARDELLNELSRLRAVSIVVSSNVPLRRDGLMRGDGNPIDAGVAVYFKLAGKPMVFACDRWTRVEHNLWAIARTIEAQCGVTRWGVVEVERAFASYTALPERAEAESCWAVLGVPEGSGPETVRAAYREKAKAVHPDAGGSNAAMAMLNAARDAALK